MTDRLGRREFLSRTARISSGGLVIALATPALSGVASAAPLPITASDPGLLIDPASQAGGGALPRSLASTELLGWADVVYDQVKAERFSPPSAARAYAHVFLAAYEVVAAGSPHLRSIAGQLNGFLAGSAHIPHSGKAVSWPLAMNEAIAVAATGVFSDRSDASRQALTAYAQDRRLALSHALAEPIQRRSIAVGQSTGQRVAARADGDGYLNILGRPYIPPTGPDKWVRTPPNFGSAIEPYWSEVLSFTLERNDECKPIPPVPYSEEVGSAFWNEANIVYETSFLASDEQRLLALFWRDNPDGSTGLPAGHWIRIAATVIGDQGMALDRAAEVMALTAISTADGFTSCWTEKYDTNLLRPVTYVQRLIDSNWNTFVNSPAFPEYTSGHSVGSAAAAGMLTTLLGDNVGFLDTVGRQNGYPDRWFNSFWEAANEAALSRLWGSIHYPMGIDEGVAQGAKVAEVVAARIRTR